MSVISFHFQHLMQMCSVACENVSALSVDGILQMHFLQAGALWHLLLFLFDYDYTLEEGGVAADGKVAYIMAFTQYHTLRQICGE